MGLNEIRFKLLVFISILMSEMSVTSENELCDNTVVYSVDRFNNNTIRLFRNNDFWDLSGFPDNIKVGTKGSMKDYQFFNPVKKSARIVTVLEGSPTIKDRTFKFDGVFWWSWYNHPKFGLRYVATSAGLYWDQIPNDHGFDAVFHNGDKNDPMLIGLEADPKSSDEYMKIHYFSTKNETFVRKSSQYFDQNDFPKDLTDAFSWPPTEDLKYLVYILKADNYCILSDKQKCTEWKSFRQLIGCSGEPKPQPLDEDNPSSTSDEEIPERENTASPQTQDNRGEESGRGGGGEGLVPPVSDKPNRKPSTEWGAPSGQAAQENVTTEGSSVERIASSILLIVVSFVLNFI